MKIRTKLIIGLCVIIIIIGSVQYVQFSLSESIRDISQYHDQMSIPALTILPEIQIEFEKLNKGIHGFKLGHIHDKEEYYISKELLLEKISKYETLTYEKKSNQEYFANSVMQTMMLTFVTDMRKQFMDYDDIANKIFLTSDDDSSVDLFSLLDEKHSDFDTIVQNGIKMEHVGKSAQQALVKKIESLTNTFIIFSNIGIFLSVFFIIAIIGRSISSEINELRDITHKIAKGNYNITIKEKNDEFQSLRNDIQSMRTSIKLGISKKIKDEKLITLGSFSSRLAHDLRNPLSIIRISMENLKLVYGVDVEKQKYFDKVNRSIDRITHQVDDVLNYVKGEPADMVFASFTQILNESINSLNISDKIKIVLPKNNVNLICDQKQILITMNNLILNSIQSIRNTGTIEITIEEKDDEIIIEVKDSGVGISEEKLGKVFEPMYTSKQQGSGLGLVSVKSIIELHGGVISVTSPPTVFTITLPKRAD